MERISESKKQMIKSLIQIDKMIYMAKTDSSIDVEDLREERKLCVARIKKMK